MNNRDTDFAFHQSAEALYAEAMTTACPPAPCAPPPAAAMPWPARPETPPEDDPPAGNAPKSPVPPPRPPASGNSPNPLPTSESSEDSLPSKTARVWFYGYRYYDPVTGRWPSRDPIREKGGVNLYSFVYNNPVSFFDRFGLQVWAQLTIDATTQFQIDMKFRFKICVCDEDNNPDLAVLTKEEVGELKRAVQVSLEVFEKNRHNYQGLNIRGTLKIWPEYIGAEDGKCGEQSIEESNSEKDPYFNVIFVEEDDGPGKGSAHTMGVYQTKMYLAQGQSQRTLSQEIGHMIGYHHPHRANPDDTPVPFKDDIMVQIGNTEGVGTGTQSHPNYMH